MKVPDIMEEERQEIRIALSERKKNLEKLEEKTDEAGVPIDRFEERLALYRDRDEVIEGVRNIRPGLLAIFADEPELSTEALENQTRKVDDRPDLFGGGVETGGGHKPGRKERGKGKRGGDPQHIGEIITPPAPREPLGLPAAGTPSNNENVIDPTATHPTEEGIADIRSAVKMGLEDQATAEAEPLRAELATAASAATPSGRQITDVRTSRDTKMDGQDFAE